MDDLETLLRVGAGFELSAVDPGSTPGFVADEAGRGGGKKAGEKALAAAVPELADRQERLFANGRRDDARRVLLVLQAMDTAGKGGIVKHVVGSVDPQGVRIHAFKAPTDEERAHDFLWRIRRELPAAGELGVFDRSHYEDVLIHRVRGFSTPEVIEQRYGLINDFEAELVAAGTTVVKVMLHLSPDEQKARLAARLADPTKHWKYSPGDLEERAFWPAYQEAYQLALTRTSTEVAPWFVVPADRKWYARVAVQHLLIAALRRLDQGWPAADFDVALETAKLQAG
jgi:PPK2 family polyphosphate:nucleotide phosphotransferase